jgi:hypothetical protein
MSENLKMPDVKPEGFTGAVERLEKQFSRPVGYGYKFDPPTWYLIVYKAKGLSEFPKEFEGYKVEYYSDFPIFCDHVD